MEPGFIRCRPAVRGLFAYALPRALALLAVVLLTATLCVHRAWSQSGRVVAEAKHTSAYDAFMKMNRLQESLEVDQSAAEYWGVLTSRLGNQAGRNLIKRPVEGFSEDAFFGWMAFMRAYGTHTGIGNCAACHQPPEFTDGKPHNVATGKKNIVPPSLRELHNKKVYFHDGSAKTLEAAIRAHVKNGRIARQRKRELIDIDLGLISLTDEEVGQVAEFLRSLKPLDREAFREALVNVQVQPLDIEDLE